MPNKKSDSLWASNGSFFCERTAEYALVPVAQSHLAKAFDLVIPIYYWKTREGNRVASYANSHRSYRVLAMFARRPKLTFCDSILLCRINHELHSFAAEAREMGIPTIAAFPAVSSLPALYQDPHVFWIPLDKPFGENFLVDISRPKVELTSPEGVLLATIPPENIASLVHSNAITFSWDDAMSSIWKLRMERDRRYFPYGYGGYRPVYFLIS